ncbi:TIGR02678 family protein [Streptomyces sp. NBC_01433]|uniref:TIGR02678 family protein n=1 Tax=Streptomyces sp. NBC_01433 TaxID=2903864 RepID=UPI0022506D48|nr:TIGR02678 family protein [Streptomyces sp. NBC_01433]MCX4680150.1 TIGR02678 family protein [Streptomyces sp. NBC_01433]
MSNFANQLVTAEREELARCIRTLLVRPLLTERSDPAVFDLVRRRRDPLAHWFDYHCGWTLVVEPRLGYARLMKVRGDADATRPARRTRSGRAPFDRRRYVLLCVTAAELLSVPVTTIGLLADRVVQAAATDEALPSFDTAQRAERVAFVDVLRLLESYGALRTVDGTTDSFADSAEAKVLYRVDPTVLMRLLAAPCGPSRLAVPASGVPAGFETLLAGLVQERRYWQGDSGGGTGDGGDGRGRFGGDGGDRFGGDGGAASEGPEGSAPESRVSSVQRNLWLRHSVLRRLFDEPVLHRDELSEAQLGYLTSPTGRQILRRAAEQAGFVLEERAEGFLLVDPEAIATDSRFPDGAQHAKVAALLLLDVLTAAPAGCAPEQLAAEAGRILDRFPRWGKAYRGENGATALAEDAVRALAEFGLVRHEGGRVVPRPAAARYRVTSATLKEEHPA